MQDKNLIVSVWIVVFPPKGYANSVQELSYVDKTTGTTVNNRATRQFAVYVSANWRTAMLKCLNIDIPLVTQEDTDMLSYSESLKEYGREEGIEIGKTEGIGIGIRRQMSKYMENGHSFDEAFDLLAEPGMDREEVRKELLS